MPEGTPKQDLQIEVHAQYRKRINEQIGWLQEAAEAVAGTGAVITEVFDQPPEARDDAPMPDWTPEQEEKNREIGKRFGYGAEQNVPSGLSGGVRIMEGGMVWKMMAEAEALKDEDRPKTLVFAGSPFLKLNEKELTFLREKHNVSMPDDATQYDAARWLAERQADKAVSKKPIVLHFGYGVSEGNPIAFEATGQLVYIGETLEGQSVQLLRVDREIYQDADGNDKYRYQPDTARVMGILAEVLKAQGNDHDSVGLVTSNTYASRQVDAIRAGLDHSRRFGVAMYGRETLRGLGAPVPQEMALNHLPGDLRVTYDKLLQLKTEIEVSEQV
ncbi:MAG: hypothetical protein WA843_02130 [Candidatus Saccharimonadales bacterium]